MPQESSPEALALIQRCREFGFVESELNGGVIVEIPSKGQYLSTLPQSGATEQAQHFLEVYRVFKKLSPKRPHGRWHVWHTGSYRRDGYHRQRR